MELKEVSLKIAVYASSAELNAEDAALLEAARDVTQFAYAPYSHFFVGAAGLLANGKIVKGTNQENASYPVGICAERVLLSCIASQFPGEPLLTMAVSYSNSNGGSNPRDAYQQADCAVSYSNSNGGSNRPISPCGICRQTLVEYQERTKTAVRIILSGMSGEVFVIEDAKQLLPLSFTAGDMNM